MTRRYSWREFLGLLNPREWDALFWLLVPVIGALATLYIAGVWTIHLALSHSWGLLIAVVVVPFVVSVAAWLRFPWAAYLLAAVVAISAAAVSTGHVDVLLP